MLNEQARLTDRVGQDYVLVLRGDKPFGPHWHDYQLVSPEHACGVVQRSITSAHSSNWQLLRLLGIREHALGTDPLRLARTIQGVLWRYELYRIHPRLGGSVLAPLITQAPRAPIPPTHKPTHFIIVEAVSPAGVAMPGIPLAVTVPDGSGRTLITDSYGRASVDGIDAGICRIELPGIDRSLWTASGAHGELVTKEAGPIHVVQQGESLSSIADKYSYRSWQVVWSNAQNAALRSKRKSPHVLLPGDRVHLPELEVGQIERGTDATHRIVIDKSPEALVTVRLQLESRWKRALDGLAYTLSFMHEGQLVTRPGAAPSSHAGLIEEKIPARTESVLFAFSRPKVCFKLRVGALDPLQDGDEGPAFETGVRARLRALGYAHPGLDAHASLTQFQKLELGSSQPTGKLDATTRDKIEELYGV